MNQRGYAIAFIFVLLAAITGAFFGGRFLWRQLQGGSLRPSAVWQPPLPATAAARVTLTPAIAASATQPPVPGGQPLAAAEATALASGRLTPTSLVIPTPQPGDIAVGTLQPSLTRPSETVAPGTTPVTFEGTPVALNGTPIDFGGTPAVTDTPSLGDFPFVPAGAVRDTDGDCPGVYVLGTVTDRAAKPLSGVRLNLNDEYGNTDSKVTKGEAGVEGKYDFPLSGPPRRFFLRIVDNAGNPLSPEVLINHGSGAHPGATCHWVDWQGR